MEYSRGEGTITHGGEPVVVHAAGSSESSSLSPALAASPPVNPSLKGCAGLCRSPGYTNIIK